jgi:RuvB-like protein 1 (pontin 52)
MAPVQISEVKGNARENRTATHSHIKGLGLRNDGAADTNGAGFIGQAGAREVSCRPFSSPVLLYLSNDALCA